MSVHVEKNTSMLRSLIRETPERASELVRSAAQDITNDIKQSYGTSPSAPGQPPGVDTGALRASIDWFSEGALRAIVHDGVEYGLPLEVGTTHIRPRPHFNPVFMLWRQRKFVQLAREIMAR